MSSVQVTPYKRPLLQQLLRLQHLDLALSFGARPDHRRLAVQHRLHQLGAEQVRLDRESIRLAKRKIKLLRDKHQLGLQQFRTTHWSNMREPQPPPPPHLVPRAPTRTAVEWVAWALGVLAIIWFVRPIDGIPLQPVTNGFQPTPQAPTDIISFTGHDCNAQTVLDRYSRRGPETCQQQRRVEEEPARVPYALVEATQPTTIHGYTCARRTSQVHLSCGMFSHISISALPSFLVPDPPSREECRTWTEEGSGVFYGKRFDLAADAETVVVVATAGQLNHHDQVVDCTGITETVEDQTVKKSFSVVQHSIVISRVNFKVRDGQIYNPETHEVLPCHFLSHSCQDAVKTSIWSTEGQEEWDDRTCRLKIVNTFDGVVQVEDDQYSSFTDEDKKFRVTMGKAVTLCQTMEARSTPYAHLYMIPVADIDQTLQKSTKPQLSDWVASRDDFLSAYTEKLVAESQGESRMDRCVKDLANQPQRQGLHHVSENVFNLIRGEVNYAIACRTVNVTPRSTTQCTQDLPVQNLQGEHLYLQAQTRLLKKFSPVIDCSMSLPPAYETTAGHWVVFTPQLRLVEPPKLPDLALMDDPRRHLDMVKEAGIKSLDDVRRQMEDEVYADYHQAVLHHVVAGVCQYDAAWSGDCPPSSFNLASITTPAQLQQFARSTWSKFKIFCTTAGEIASIIVVIYLVIALLMALVRLILRCGILLPRHGLNAKTIKASFRLSEHIYDSWWKDVPLFEEPHRQQPPSPIIREDPVGPVRRSGVDRLERDLYNSAPSPPTSVIDELTPLGS